MRFHTTVDISQNRSFTPEGFLICRNVPIARTGNQTYFMGEVPVTADANGQVTIQRDPEEVFHPDAVASFEGKPVTLRHPEDAVTPGNWSELSKGHVQNVRQGAGLESDALYADLLIMDKGTIEEVTENRIREVSCGYDADYMEIEPGKGKQMNIRGNHVALVERGRCGSLCAVKDAKMSIEYSCKSCGEVFTKLASEQEVECPKCGSGDLRKEKIIKDAVGKTELISKILKKERNSMSNTGGDYIESYKKELEAKDLETLKAIAEDNGIRFEDSKTKDSKEGGIMKGIFKKMFSSLTADEQKELGVTVKDSLTIDQRIDKLESSVIALVKMMKDAAEKEETEDEETEEEKKRKEAAAKDEFPPKKEDEETKDCDFGKSKDAAPVLQELLYRASILAPDLKPLTADSAKSRKTFDEMCCLHKRKSLDAAARTEDGKAAITPFTRGSLPDFFTADCATVDSAFVGASELMKAKSTMRVEHKTSDFFKGGISAAEINKSNAAYWAARKVGK